MEVSTSSEKVAENKIFYGLTYIEFNFSYSFFKCLWFSSWLKISSASSKTSILRFERSIGARPEVILASQCGTVTTIYAKSLFVSLSPIHTVKPNLLVIASITEATCLINSLVFAKIITWILLSFRSTRIIDGIPNANVFPEPLVA